MGTRWRILWLGGAMLVVSGAPVEAFGGTVTDVLPDLRPRWGTRSMGDIRFGIATRLDRLVSCDDWTQIDPTPITGQYILSFDLSSFNAGPGHLRVDRSSMSDGFHMIQRTSQIDEAGTCSSVETEVAIVPTDQAGRWLPLARLALYQEAEDGGIGDLVSCQIERWCCIASAPTCSVNPPCALPSAADNINAGALDISPGPWVDQLIPIEGVPSGRYWVEDTINPGNVLIESDYTNNSMFFKIALSQEAHTVQILEEPDGSFSTCPL